MPKALALELPIHHLGILEGLGIAMEGTDMAEECTSTLTAAIVTDQILFTPMVDSQFISEDPHYFVLSPSFVVAAAVAQLGPLPTRAERLKRSSSLKNRLRMVLFLPGQRSSSTLRE